MKNLKNTFRTLNLQVHKQKPGTLDIPIEDIGTNVWCCILRFVDIYSLLSFGCTCKYAHKLINEISSRDFILSNMELRHINYADRSKSNIITNQLGSISNPVGNVLVYHSFEYPGNRCTVAVTMGFFKGTSTRYYYFHSPGRCDNFIIRIYNDGDKELQEVYLNASSHSTTFLSYQINDQQYDIVRGGPCEKPKEWEAAVNILKRLLTLAGFNTDMESWIDFAKRIHISSYFTAMFLPPGPELDNMIGNTYDIYSWLGRKNISFW